MSSFRILRATVSTVPDGRQVVRAVAEHKPSGSTIAIWEHVERGRVLDTMFAAHWRGPFRRPLEKFLLGDLDGESLARLVENGGHDWRVAEQYGELMGQVERLLAMHAAETSLGRPPSTISTSAVAHL